MCVPEGVEGEWVARGRSYAGKEYLVSFSNNNRSGPFSRVIILGVGPRVEEKM